LSLPDGSSVQALAINDDASVFAIADASGKLIVYGPELTSELDLPTSAVVFNADGDSIAAIDNSRKAVAIVSKLKATPEIIEVASERDGLKNPSAVAFATASSLLVADTESSIHIVDLAAVSVQSIGCACRPNLVEKTAHSNIFRITAIDAGAVWVIRLGSEPASAMFIPVQRDDPAEASTQEAVK
jgi:hypothetical protein